MSTIPVIVEETQNTNLEGTLSGGVLTPGTVVKELDTGKLRKSLSNLSGQISEILQDIKTVGGFKLNEVVVSVEIGSEGGISLIGTVKAKASSAISLKFSA